MRRKAKMKKILVIEDNETNLYLLRYILHSQGFEVLEAMTGKTGVEKALTEKPDLILMDIQLPDIDGLEATRRIRSSAADGKVPIIALTSYAMTGDRQMALDAGCTGYIAKPINPETFMADIQKYL
jgi:two-component system, cell cycle response regulator DivK